MDTQFLSFDATVNFTSFGSLSACIFSWLEEYCKPQVYSVKHILITCTYSFCIRGAHHSVYTCWTGQYVVVSCLLTTQFTKYHIPTSQNLCWSHTSHCRFLSSFSACGQCEIWKPRHCSGLLKPGLDRLNCWNCCNLYWILKRCLFAGVERDCDLCSTNTQPARPVAVLGSNKGMGEMSNAHSVWPAEHCWSIGP